MHNNHEYESYYSAMREDQIAYLTKAATPNTFLALFSRQTLVEDLRSICSKTHYNHKTQLFYKALLYLDIIIFEAGLHPHIQLDYNLLILTALSLGIKFTQNQINIPRLQHLQHLSSKFSSYTSDEYIANEMLCIELLDYHLVYSSPYDYFLMFIDENNENLLDKATEYLDQLACHRFYLQRHPYVIACIVMTYAMEILQVCNDELGYRFYYDKENPWYVKIVKAIENSYKTKGNSNGNGTSNGMMNMHKTISYSDQKGGMIDSFAKMRQMTNKSKEMILLNNKGEEEDCCKKSDDDDTTTIVTNDSSSSTCNSNSNMNTRSHQENLESYKGIRMLREQTRRSCANVINNPLTSINNILRASTNILNCSNSGIKAAMNTSNILRANTNISSITSTLLRNSGKKSNDGNNQTPTKLFSNNNNNNNNTIANERKLDYKLNLDMDAFAKIHQRRTTSLYNSAQKSKTIEVFK